MLNLTKWFVLGIVVVSAMSCAPAATPTPVPPTVTPTPVPLVLKSGKWSGNSEIAGDKFSFQFIVTEDGRTITSTCFAINFSGDIAARSDFEDQKIYGNEFAWGSNLLGSRVGSTPDPFKPSLQIGIQFIAVDKYKGKIYIEGTGTKEFDGRWVSEESSC